MAHRSSRSVAAWRSQMVIRRSSGHAVALDMTVPSRSPPRWLAPLPMITRGGPRRPALAVAAQPGAQFGLLVEHGPADPGGADYADGGQHVQVLGDGAGRDPSRRARSVVEAGSRSRASSRA